jgi:phosphoribosylglycinamide formyltransferase-1
VRVAILASGSGTILEAMVNGGIPVALVVTDRSCRASAIASQNDIGHVLVERESFGNDFDRVTYTIKVRDALLEKSIDLVVMAGFGTILEQPLYETYKNNVLNTHPSLLPSFPGWHAVKDALNYGVKVTGCTVHVATREVDAGPILAQKAVDVLPDDSVETLHERIKTVERRLYLQTVHDIIEEGKVVIPR